MSTPDRLTKTQRRDEARAAALKLREQQQRIAKRQRTIAIAAAVGGAIVLTVLIWTILAQGNRPALADVALRPAGSTLSGGIPVGADGVAGGIATPAADAIVVAVYSDYLCPICGVFEQTNGPTLDELRQSGEIVVEYHPVSILDRASGGTAYSTRSATAAALVAAEAPETFVDFHNALFANQPAESSDTPYLTDVQIADLARTAGVPDAVAATIESGEYLGTQTDAAGKPLDQTYVPWVLAATEQASKDLGQLGTPTIVIDGKVLDTDQYNWQEPGVLAQAIQDAKG
jgi:protein-disulfide isomerase